MCGHKNRARAAPCGAGLYGAGCRSTETPGGSRAVMAIITGIQQMNLASQQQQQQHPRKPSTTTRAAYIAPQTQGIVYDEKAQLLAKDGVNFEVLPSYEESNATPNPRARTVEPAFVRSTGATHQSNTSGTTVLAQNTDRVLPSQGLDIFSSALASYRSGACGGRGQAKRAARHIMNELLDQEIARKRAAHGQLVCGQRKQIRRDLQPVKDMLKSAIREAKRDRVH